MRLGWHLPLDRLSATSMALAIQCPESFRQRYILRDKKEIMFGSRFIGIVDHATNEKILQRKSEGQEVDIDVIYKEAWNKVISREGEPDWRDDDPVKMQATGIKMAKTYHDAVTINPVALEERFEVKVPGLPIPVVGFLDVVEADKIRERKTTGVKTTKPKSKWRFQGVVYQFATGLPVQWDVVTRQVTPQLYLAQDWPELYLKVQDINTTQQLIKDAAKRINDLYVQYGEDHPWPMTGMLQDWLCNYCVIGPRYEGTCPAWQT